MAKPAWSQGGAEELPASQVFKDFVKDHGLTPNGPTRNPWQMDPLPPEISDAPVQFYIYNVSPLKRQICMGGLGTKQLWPCKKGEPYAKNPLKVKRYEVDHAGLGDYKLKNIIIEGKDMVREMVTPGGDIENDLRPWGIFYSTTCPPSDEEIAEANRRLRITFDNIIKRGDVLYENPATRSQITNVFLVAAKWNRAVRPWCTVSKEMADCPGCLQPVDKAAPIHACGPGITAILDWEKAYRLNLVTKERYDEAVAKGWLK